MSITLRNQQTSLSQSFQLANDSEMRMLLGFSPPPRAGRISAINGAVYTVEIADGDDATITARSLNGFSYELDNVVYVMQATNAPDSGVIIGRNGASSQLGIGTSPDGPLHVEDANGGFAVVSAASINATEQTLLNACVAQVVTGDVLAAHGATYNTASLGLVVPVSSYNSQNVSVGATTIQFRLYASGDLRVIRTAGTGTPTAILRALYI